MNLKKENKTPSVIQPNDEKCQEIIEQSFLKDIFTDDLTDIQYNGYEFYGQDNQLGRFKLDLNISNEEVFSILKQLANYALKPFSVKNPILNISFKNYRLSAIHPILARKNNEKVATFSLRKISPTLKITNNNVEICPKPIHALLEVLIKGYQSIVISGLTGSGKTELQKYLVSKMNEEDRIIMIEDNYETYLKEIYPSLDITTWIADETNISLSELVKTSLRHNPDWIMIAETRGKEAFELVESISSGHPMITTIHSDSSLLSLERILKMFQKELDFNEEKMLSEMATHIRIGIHIEKQMINQKIIRKITEVTEYIPTKHGYDTRYLFHYDTNGQPIYHSISVSLFDALKKHHLHFDMIEPFIPKERENEKK